MLFWNNENFDILTNITKTTPQIVHNIKSSCQNIKTVAEKELKTITLNKHNKNLAISLKKSLQNGIIYCKEYGLVFVFWLKQTQGHNF